MEAEIPMSPRFPPNAPRVVEVLAFPSVQLLDVAGSLQVFATANELVAKAGGAPRYAARVVAEGGQIVTASAGHGLVAVSLSPIEAPLDTLLVAGGRGVQAAAADPALVDWARAVRARRIASVYTGAFLLAAAGLLDGRRAATHWTFCAELARRFPAQAPGRTGAVQRRTITSRRRSFTRLLAATPRDYRAKLGA